MGGYLGVWATWKSLCVVRASVQTKGYTVMAVVAAQAAERAVTSTSIHPSQSQRAGTARPLGDTEHGTLEHIARFQGAPPRASSLKTASGIRTSGQSELI